MNTPFSRPDLANFIKTGTDAVVSKVTFPDGTSQTTAASGAANEVTGVTFSSPTLSLQRTTGADLTTTIATGSFTPVAFVGQYNTNRVYASYAEHHINPDTVLVNEGITSGGSPHTYGWNDWTGSTGQGGAGENYWKVSSDMAGLYQFSITLSVGLFVIPAGPYYGGKNMDGPMIEYINGASTTQWLEPKRSLLIAPAPDTTSVATLNLTTVVRMAAESELRIYLPKFSFDISGKSTSEPGGTVSIIKIAD